MMLCTHRFNCAMLVRFVFILLSGLAGCTTSGVFQPSAEGLEPGLAVVYFDADFKGRTTLPYPNVALGVGRQGKPIPMLNHRFGKGEVFDSGRNRHIGVLMTGFMNFPQTGNYILKANSNDGIRVYVNEKVIVEDWGRHSDRFSTPGGINIQKVGWYPLMIEYFQRRGTATIELYWKKPGSSDFAIIPAEAYGHARE